MMMIKNKLITFGLLAVLCALFVMCSRSDVVTGVGGDVVRDMDGTLTDMAAGFLEINLVPGDVEETYSLPAAPDSAFSTQASTVISVGVSDHGDTLAAHMQFQVRRFIENNQRYFAEDTLAFRDDPLKAYLYFIADDSAKASDPIKVFPSDTLTGLRPVSRADKIMIGDEDDAALTDNSIGSFAFAEGRNSVDSVRLDTAMARRIFNVRTGISKDMSYEFAFSIVDYLGNVRRIRNPYVIVHVPRALTSQGIARDSISSFTRYTAYENSEMAPIRAAAPFSSQLTLRTAVYKINIDKIRDGLKNAPEREYELINAVVSFVADTARIGADISGEAVTAALPQSAGNYRIVVLDTLINTELAQDSLSMGLLDHFARAQTAAQIEPFCVHQIKPILRSALEKPNSALYIYLRSYSDRGTAVWKWPKETPPLEKRHIVEAMFTPSRQQ